MAWRKFRRSAYYGGNYGAEYSRSRRAQESEDDGRLPKTKAAKLLGISTKVFDAARHEIDYFPNEWHHVGKYANIVTFYDTNYLNEHPEFWLAVALAQKTKRKLIEFFKRFWMLKDKELVPTSHQLNLNNP